MIDRGAEVPEPTRIGAEVRAPRFREESAPAKTVCVAFKMPAAMAPWLALLRSSGRRSAVAVFEGKIARGGFLVLSAKSPVSASVL